MKKTKNERVNERFEREGVNDCKVLRKCTRAKFAKLIHTYVTTSRKICFVTN